MPHKNQTLDLLKLNAAILDQALQRIVANYSDAEFEEFYRSFVDGLPDDSLPQFATTMKKQLAERRRVIHRIK